MGNVNPDFDLDSCERFFAPLAEIIRRFAARRNLALTKYDHDSPYWDLLFTHPSGAVGKIALGKGKDGNLELSAVVWRDDYDSFTRHLRSTPVMSIEAAPEALGAELQRCLEEVLTWSTKQGFRAIGGYEQIWSQLGKQVFESSRPSYPIPIR